MVGKDTPFGILEDARVGAYLQAIEGDERAPQPSQDDTLVSDRIDIEWIDRCSSLGYG